MLSVFTPEDLAAFAAQRDEELLDLQALIAPEIADALGRPDFASRILQALREPWLDIYLAEGGRQRAAQRDWLRFQADLVEALHFHTGEPHDADQVERISLWLATATVNGATYYAAPVTAFKRWITMRDEDVRPTHQTAEGQTVPVGRPFKVCDQAMQYPGEPTGDPSCFLNCRCVMAVSDALRASAEEMDMTDLLTAQPRPAEQAPPKKQPGPRKTPPQRDSGPAKRQPPPRRGEPTGRERPLEDVRDANNQEECETNGGQWDEETQSCVEAEVPPEEAAIESDMADTDFAETGPLEWHAVLAPEGAKSGDGRMFSPGALTWRDLPLPLSWQRAISDGHDGSIVVGKIENIERIGDLIYGDGVFLSNEDSDEVIGLLAEGALRGISIDVDSAVMATEPSLEDLLGVGGMEFSEGRICGATVVPIGAFSQAFIQLGPRMVEQEDVPDQDLSLEVTDSFISEKPWDGSSSRFTPAEWKRSCCMHISQEVEPKSNHKLPVREPGGQLNRAAVHNAAARVNQVQGPPAAKSAAKSCLRGCYGQLNEPVPDALKASGELSYEDCHEADTMFKRGAGWVTNPIATRRIHSYWTTPGEPGYAKIGWGTGDDFFRCRHHLGKYVDPLYLNRTCALWHHDALGYWPAEHARMLRRHSASTTTFGVRTAGLGPAALPSSVALVASNSLSDYSIQPLLREWFLPPELTGPTPLTITDQGRVYGHMALWDTCHIAIRGTCVTPPHSLRDYDHFLLGSVNTDKGAVSVGHITMGTGHADIKAGMASTLSHYENTGTVVADVVSGEDDFGIWVNGAVRPEVTPEQRHALQAAKLSGDWRRVGNSLELVAVLAVNVPGFPVPRTGLAASGGVQTSLVASGIPSSAPVTVEAVALAAARMIRMDNEKRSRVSLVANQVRRLRVERLLTTAR